MHNMHLHMMEMDVKKKMLQINTAEAMENLLSSFVQFVEMQWVETMKTNYRATWTHCLRDFFLCMCVHFKNISNLKDTKCNTSFFYFYSFLCYTLPRSVCCPNGAVGIYKSDCTFVSHMCLCVRCVRDATEKRLTVSFSNIFPLANEK